MDNFNLFLLTTLLGLIAVFVVRSLLAKYKVRFPAGLSPFTKTTRLRPSPTQAGAKTRAAPLTKSKLPQTLTAIIIFCALLAGNLPTWFKSEREVSGYQQKARVETPDLMAAMAIKPNLLSNWPPEVNKKFPDVHLYDHKGHDFSLEKLKGKPVLIQFVAMTCAGCQAYSGANRVGAYAGFASQQNLDSVMEYFHQFSGGRRLFDGSVYFVQLINYDLALQAPSPEQLSAWRKHFGFDRPKNTFIVSGGEPLRNKDTFQRIPGFMLLDQELIVRFDGLGHNPVHNPYTETLAGVKLLLNKDD